MEELLDFRLWLKSEGGLSDTSIEKYSRAVRTVSNDMINAGVIDNRLENMNADEYEANLRKIMNNDAFVEKNTTGNNMYSCGLKWFRNFKNSFIDIGDIKDIDIDKEVGSTETEKEQIIKARIGQGKFRDLLFEKYDGKCIITGISLNKVLVASHIRPWAACTNEERLDVNNGLLLSATFDRLFDGGLITFDKDGKIFISKQIKNSEREKIGLKSGISYNLKINGKMKEYLEYHNDILFIK